jgi:hypothetical protein
MHPLKPVALVVVTSTFLFCCQNSMQSVQGDQEAKLAVMQEKEKSILAECELKRLRGELKTYAQSAECSNPVIVQAHQEAGDPAMNLVYLFTAYRLAIADRIDRGALSQPEGNLMLAQLVSRINTERLQRDMAAAQQRARSGASYEALLQGLGVWQSFSKQLTLNGTADPSRPAPPQEASQQTHGSAVTCYQNGPRIACQ